jgi:hypothetical protein
LLLESAIAANTLKFNVRHLVIGIFVFCGTIADFYTAAEVSDTTMLIKDVSLVT